MIWRNAGSWPNNAITCKIGVNVDRISKKKQFNSRRFNIFRLLPHCKDFPKKGFKNGESEHWTEGVQSISLNMFDSVYFIEYESLSPRIGVVFPLFIEWCCVFGQRPIVHFKTRVSRHWSEYFGEYCSQKKFKDFLICSNLKAFVKKVSKTLQGSFVVPIGKPIQALMHRRINLMHRMIEISLL